MSDTRQPMTAAEPRTAQSVLIRQGHSSSGFCQKCWDEAYMRSPGISQVDNYYAVMAENEAAAMKGEQE